MKSIQEFSDIQKAFLLFLIAVVGVILVAILAEGAVRVRHWIKYGGLWGIEDTYVVDEKTGLRIPRPGAEIGPIKINSLGFRGPEIDVPKPKSTIRIAFLGGSTTYCANVSSNEMTWPHLVWQELQRRWPSVKFDFVNGGVPGYGATNSEQNLKERIASLEPDIIVVYHASNDLSANSFELAKKVGRVQRRTEQTLSWPSKYSLLWYLIEKNLFILARQNEAKQSQQKLRANLIELVSPFKRDMKSLVGSSLQVADVVVVVTFSVQLRREQTLEQQAEAAVTSLYYMPYMSLEGLLDGFASYNDAIRNVAAETGAILIGDENSIPGDSVNFVDSVHFTDIGSAHMAERVSSALTDAPEFQRLIRVRISRR